MIVPVGNRDRQELVCALRIGEGVFLRMLGACRFVLLIGREVFPTSFETPLSRTLWRV